ncbi:phosphate propanoyltransferase [Lachnoclostridium pacaense]|uniref:phosphate propanoyltransferase n=1 Tax=Enterocloster hominis (ex Hitch et al. 2024) TaxID=1917870 RepID=UPI001D1023DC|nr:phosphate propanoyltransferase [Lachnoclostridium pacaense]MCC2816436.1 phosphate propanoyltransferase [Lachnoclostridium pacaense]
MDQYEAIIKLLMEAARESIPAARDNTIPVGVSNRHVHLSQGDLEALFGPGYELSRMKDLSQPGQYACKETVTICGPKGAIEKVRILGPVRSRTQVEILAGDSFKLGIKSTARLSGDLDGTPGITIIGPKGSVQIKEGLMVAQRHIHMLPEDAVRMGVHDGQVVSLEVDGIRGGILRNTIVRVTGQSGLECHIDTEEANALGLSSSSRVKIVQ